MLPELKLTCGLQSYFALTAMSVLTVADATAGAPLPPDNPPGLVALYNFFIGLMLTVCNGLHTEFGH